MFGYKLLLFNQIESAFASPQTPEFFRGVWQEFIQKYTGEKERFSFDAIAISDMSNLDNIYDIRMGILMDRKGIIFGGDETLASFKNHLSERGRVLILSDGNWVGTIIFDEEFRYVIGFFCFEKRGLQPYD